MTDITLNYYLVLGTNAERLAWTPDPGPAPTSGTWLLPVFIEYDTGDAFYWDNTGTPGWVAWPGGAASIPDGTYGDIVVSGGGTVWTIGNDTITTLKILDSAVTLTKIANQADLTILGNNSGGAGPPIALTAAQVRTLLGLAAIATSGSASDLSTGTLAAARMPALTGDITSTAGAVATVLAAPLTPGGRLTLTSNTPVMAADATAQGTVYYTPYVSARLPLYTGSVWAMRAFSQSTPTLNSTDNTSTNLYDIFVVDVGGTLTLATGPAWTNSTTRADAITMLNGIWVNNASIALRAGGSALTGSPFAANLALYLGTIYCTANGQTGMAFQPSAAAGGSAAILGLYNAYNRVRVSGMSRDSTASWTYNSGTWRATNNNANNRVSYIDGLAQAFINARSTIMGEVASSNYGSIGINRDSTSATPALALNFGLNSTPSVQFPVHVGGEFLPSLGFHYIQGMEARPAGAGNVTFYGGGYQSVVISLEM